MIEENEDRKLREDWENFRQRWSRLKRNWLSYMALKHASKASSYYQKVGLDREAALVDCAIIKTPVYEHEWAARMNMEGLWEDGKAK